MPFFDALSRLRYRLACRHAKCSCQRHCRLRTRKRLSVSQRRSPSSNQKRRLFRGHESRRSVDGSFLETHALSHRDFYGDYIPKAPTTHPHNDYWRAASEMADLFAAAVNRHGGDTKVIRLPDIGIHGNSHFPFAEKNNQEVAEVFKNGWEKSNSTIVGNNDALIGITPGILFRVRAFSFLSLQKALMYAV